MAGDGELLLLAFGLDLSALKSIGSQAKSALGSLETDGGLTFELVGFDLLDQIFSKFPDQIKAGVKLSGPAVAYSLVWEWGRVDIHPGPKTQWSTNPDGETTVLTIQAPHGWIRVNRQRYLEFLQEHWGDLDLNSKPIGQWVSALHDMLWDASSDCAKLMDDTAPVDTGQLRSGIIAVNEPDPILEEGTDTELQLGTEWL